MGLFKRSKKPGDDAGKDDEKRSPSDSNTPNEPSGDDFSKADLSEAQVKILKDQIGFPNDAKATIFAVYRYAGGLEFAMIAVSAICSVGAGIISPLMIIVFGQLVGDLSDSVADLPVATSRATRGSSTSCTWQLLPSVWSGSPQQVGSSLDVASLEGRGKSTCERS
jgi:hypothetical protein